MSNQLRRRLCRVLSVVMGVALVAGLAANVVVPAPAARAAASSVSITINVDGEFTADQLTAVLAKYLDTANLDQEFNRDDTATYVDAPGFNNTINGVPFSGTVSASSSGIGLNATVSAGDAPTNPLNGFWQGGVSGLLGSLSGNIVRMLCVFGTLPRIPGMRWIKRGINAGCAYLGQFMSNIFTGLLYGAFKGPQNIAPLVLQTWKAIGTAFGSFSWESSIAEDFQNWLYSLATGWEQIPGNLLFPAPTQAAISTAATELRTLGEDVNAGQASASGVSAPTASTPPCDIYSYYGTPCVVAYSTTRSLYDAYNGPLYEVTRVLDGSTNDIYPLFPGGPANAAAQDSFCASGGCRISKVFDQSPDWNDATPGPAGEADPADSPADAAALPVKIGNNAVYGLDFTGGVGYRDNAAVNTATDADPEGMYMVTSGTNVNSKCCFDFGNAENNSTDKGPGYMDALNFGTNCYTGDCTGSGPWVAADLEDGLFQGGGNGTNLSNAGNSSNFVTAVLKNDGTSKLALKGGNSQSGGLDTWYDGPLPTVTTPRGGYVPMRKDGAVTLGVGGDNSNGGVGSFFEGAMTTGYPDDAAEDLIQQNVVQTDYTGDSAGTSIPQSAGAAVVHQGYTSVYSVNAENGDLEETYLAAQGAPWAKHDLSAMARTPPVKPGTTPVAVVHDGYTSVFTISASDNHVWETYLSNVGNVWASHDLTVIGKTPPSKVTPSALYHNGYTTVYTIDASDGHLDTTYLTAIGGNWTTADLTEQTSQDGAPPAQPGTSPVSVLHDGYASVFTVGTDHDIWETYLPTINGTWSAHNLTALSDGPQTTSTVTTVFHQGYLSVYAAGDPLRHLWELYLPAIGGAWKSQDLTAGGPKAPPVAPGTSPAGLFHTGYTSVYTVGQGSMHVEETYLSGIGSNWATHDLSAMPAQTPPTTETPIALLHPGTDGALDRTSVFTINQFDNDLQDTDLVAIGDNWATQDLTYETKGPPVMVNASPTATWSVANDGYTYAFTVDSNGDLRESYLTAMGASWQTGTLRYSGAGGVAVMSGTEPVAVAWAGHVSVFTIGAHGHVWESYLSANGAQWTSQDLTAATNAPLTAATAVTPAAVFHGGYLSVYTVDDNGNNLEAGNLREYFLPLGSAAWQTQDIGGAGLVSAHSSPTALYHDGYTSVFTVEDNTGDLLETYLTSIGGNWATQDLTKATNGPTLALWTTPVALYHSGYTSVYTVGGFGHLVEFFLPAIGDSWQEQDLTGKYQAPMVATTTVNADGRTVPVPSNLSALYHSGYASVYMVGVNTQLYETYLQAMGDSWQNADLTKSATPAVPPAAWPMPPSPLVHYDDNGGLTWTSVFTINASSRGLQETYLPRIGDDWATQGLPS